MQIDALHGREGMVALVQAFRFAGEEFHLGVMVAVPVNSSGGYHLLFTIGETTAAMTVAETQWLADSLIHNADGMGRYSDDLQKFGRMMLSILAETPGPHGAH